MITPVQIRPGKEANKGDDPAKRDALIEAARVLFTTKGYESTTMAEVARHAGVAVGTVYLYFKNKSDLLYAVKGDWDDEFLRFMAQPEIQAIPHHLRARPFIEAAFALCEQHTDMVQLLGMQPEQIGELYDHDGSRVEEALQVMFEEGIAAGAFRPIDPKAASIIAFGMVNQVLLHCFVAEAGKDKQPYIDALVDAIERWLLPDDRRRTTDDSR
jgi:TetR/AcrR family fatty acid metabolism transcriptional regulator